MVMMNIGKMLNFVRFLYILDIYISRHVTYSIFVSRQEGKRRRKQREKEKPVRENSLCLYACYTVKRHFGNADPHK